MAHQPQESEVIEKIVGDDNSSVRNSSSSSLDEWTIIDGKEAKDSSPIEKEVKSQNDDDDDVDNEDEDEDDECLTAEEAREIIEVLEKDKLDETGDDSHVQRDEESDGISVISECDKGEHEQIVSQSKHFDNSNKIIPQVGAYMHIIIACTLAAAIGFGIGFLINPEKSHLTSSTNIEVTDEPFRSLKEASADRVFGILPTDVNTIIDNYEKNNKLYENKHSKDKKIMNKLKKQEAINIQSFENIKTFKNILDKVKFSLDTLCLMIDDKENSGCEKINSIYDLIELKNTVEYVISEIEIDASTDQFIKNINTKIEFISKTFLDDLKRIIGNSLVKIERSSDKIRRKLQKKICLIKNTMASDSKIMKLIQSQNISMENCEKITPPPKEKKNSKKYNERNLNDKNEKINKEKNNKNYKENKESLKNEEYNKKIKKYKGEMKRNFVEEYSEDSYENMRKQVWPSFKNKNKKNQEKNEKIKNEPVSPSGEVCYPKKSCSKKFEQSNKNKKEEKIANDDDWQFKRARDRHSQREENNDYSNFGWYHDRAKSRENVRHKF